jgi:hypothetical protein
MKSGLKLAALLLTLILAPRMATADAFLLQRVGPVSASVSAADPESVMGQQPLTDCQDSGDHLVEMPKRRWGAPRRWKLANRSGAAALREAIPTTPVRTGSPLDGTQGAGPGDAEARGQPVVARPAKSAFPACT